MDEQSRVLLVEDNPDLNTINRRALELCGYQVATALTLAEARDLLSRQDVDVILLDVMLPDGDGIEFCQAIRQTSAAHILFLSSKTAHEHKLRGLNMGGDDYITKPYLLEELLARVHAAMRRRRLSRPSAPQAPARGPLTLDTLHSRALVAGRELHLTRIEYQLLLALLSGEQPIAAKALYEAVWKQPLLGDASALWTHISHLKRKLEAADARLVLSASRPDGYRLEFIE